ncbi:hypothetical protein ACMU_01620 [Actibacterium mucosum KCTC 23349]|uniref:Lipoprotein n=1 Tax=Actibacterium mucosum KCTC 23349 TaxID=1454373 RepID=A0A037ZNT4_9RHOB|nr:hypothetical protein [Actibacterium mucosum]KAJ57218.1 hypothetical protein ACMU_01620 [Actibacterium mucosum KCTC 23349]
MRWVLALLLIAGCATPQTARFSGELVPVSSGFTVSRTNGLEIGFGRAAEGAIAAMEKLRGPGIVQGTTCRVIVWPDGLQAHFTSDFSGWKLGDASAGRLC